MGGKKKVTVGYRYYMGVHCVLCHGPVDEVSELIVGERRAWSGSVTESGEIGVDAPNLFGGEKREGGVKGKIDIMMGDKTQGFNGYLLQKVGGPVPAFRGLLSTVFRGMSSSRSFLWSMMNPYFKAPWWRVKRVKKGWNRGACWYPEKAAIGTLDMNAAHIVYECYTDPVWGMGYTPDDLDDTNFRSVADTLYNEGFGLSTMWMQQVSVGEFVDEMLRHVGGVRRYDIRTGQFQIKLIRNDYTVAALPQLNPSNIGKIELYERAVWGELANEVVVKYTDREQRDVSIAVQNPAAIEAEGGVISVTHHYPAIRDAALATRAAMRDLRASSTPVAKVVLTCNRVAWDWGDGDLFRLSWPLLGINDAPYRITKIDKGNLANGEIKIEAVEDLFQMPSSAYVAPVASGWVEPSRAPLPAVAQRTVEAPYWDVVNSFSAAEMAYLPSDYAFGQVLAVRPAGGYEFEIHHSPNNSTYTTTDGGGEFCPSGTLLASIPIGAASLTFTVENPYDLDEVSVGDYAYIDNELFGVTTIDTATGAVTATRGVLDSVPAAHAVGARVYFVDGTQGEDPTTRVAGETGYYKALTVAGDGVLPLASASAMNFTLVGRAQKPYPPGNLKINGVAYPSSIVETDGFLDITWSHRDRLQQTVSLVPTTSGNIGPESGTTYNLRLYNNTTGVVLQNLSGLTGTSASPALPVGDYDVRVELESVRGGLTSWQKHSYVFAFSLPSSFLVTEAGDFLVTEAGTDNFVLE